MIDSSFLVGIHYTREMHLFHLISRYEAIFVLNILS